VSQTALPDGHAGCREPLRQRILPFAGHRSRAQLLFQLESLMRAFALVITLAALSLAASSIVIVTAVTGPTVRRGSARSLSDSNRA
jgi:hypothetical protein